MYVSTSKLYMLTLTVLYVVSRSSEKGESSYWRVIRLMAVPSSSSRKGPLEPHLLCSLTWSNSWAHDFIHGVLLFIRTASAHMSGTHIELYTAWWAFIGQIAHFLSVIKTKARFKTVKDCTCQYGKAQKYLVFKVTLCSLSQVRMISAK